MSVLRLLSLAILTAVAIVVALAAVSPEQASQSLAAWWVTVFDQPAPSFLSERHSEGYWWFAFVIMLMIILVAGWPLFGSRGQKSNAVSGSGVNALGRSSVTMIDSSVSGNAGDGIRADDDATVKILRSHIKGPDHG